MAQLSDPKLSSVLQTPPQGWSTGLFDCFNDMFVCCVTTPVLYGENSRKLNNTGFLGGCGMYQLCCCVSCCFANTTRRDLRNKYGLPEEPCGDCMVHCLCSPCAVCQEARELRLRGGWKTWTD